MVTQHNKGIGNYVDFRCFCKVQQLNIFITFFRACKYIGNSVPQPTAMDWQKYIICQDITAQSLLKPAYMTLSDI